MTVYKKLQTARLALINTSIKKTGKNKFQGFEYFELGDFIPAVHKIFNDVGLCGVVTFNELAKLTVYDSDDGTSIEFCTPIVYAENAKGQDIQSLGSTHSYLRRYLWLMAMEVVQVDEIDALPQEEKFVKTKVDVKVEKATPDDVLFVDGLIEIGEMFDSLDQLTSLWKANQKQIDLLKVKDKVEFKRLQEKFAIYKEKLTLKDEENGKEI